MTRHRRRTRRKLSKYLAEDAENDWAHLLLTRRTFVSVPPYSQCLVVPLTTTPTCGIPELGKELLLFFLWRCGEHVWASPCHRDEWLKLLFRPHTKVDDTLKRSHRRRIA